MRNRTKIAKENEKKYFKLKEAVFELKKAVEEVIKYEYEWDDELAIAINKLTSHTKPKTVERYAKEIDRNIES